MSYLIMFTYEMIFCNAFENPLLYTNVIGTRCDFNKKKGNNQEHNRQKKTQYWRRNIRYSEYPNISGYLSKCLLAPNQCKNNAF